jgi:DNA-directed RNA polymerase specialized sigma24 family protein
VYRWRPLSPPHSLTSDQQKECEQLIERLRHIAARAIGRSGWPPPCSPFSRHSLPDAGQEVAVAVCRAVLHCPPDRSPRERLSYAAAVVWNHFHQLWRSKAERAKRREVPLAPDRPGDLGPDGRFAPPPACPRPGPQEPAERRDQAEAAGRALIRLKEAHPRLHPYADAALVEGRPAASLASAFNVSVRTAQLAVRTAREWLRRELGHQAA